MFIVMDESAIFPVCDFCSSKLADVYCGADSANLCSFCDRHVHSANALSFNHTRHSICANHLQGASEHAQSHAPCVAEFEYGHAKVKMELCEQLADMARSDLLRSDAEDHDHETEDDEYDDELLTSMMLMPIKYDEDDNLWDYNPTHDSSLMWEFRLESSNDSEEPGVLVPKLVVSTSSEDNRSKRAGTEKELANSSEYEHWKETKSKEAIDIHTENRGNAMLRYLEKKKLRRYDNHIRYESRKARANVRTRVKGRFVKSPEDQ